MTVQLWCLSFRQPYAGLVLDGVKTVESRWRPLLAPLENHTLAVHIAWRDWEGDEWRTVLSGVLGLDGAQIQELVDSGERFGRGVVAGERLDWVWSLRRGEDVTCLSFLAGVVDVGGTWHCPASLEGQELHELQRSAVLTGLKDKHLTQLSNPRWLSAPLSCRGSRDLWTVDIPAELLP
ncbi:protein EOLA1-like isoform X1 [Cololabis saira]|uniref:protein EOLA1-like isoform X1 n=1 Tax=Cololabis saira TaxID=129043 RepID=UPI002AD283FB|nr:protein EOLA1-like isoform X1 [Cololabis saira]